MSIEATAWALHQRCPTPTAKLVLLGLANHAHADGTGAWPSVDTLAGYADCDRRTVQRSLRALEGEGLVARSSWQPEHIDAARRPVCYELPILGRQNAAPEQEEGRPGRRPGGDTGAAQTVHEPSKDLTPTSSPSSSPDGFDWSPEVVELTREFAQLVRSNGHPLPARGTKASQAWYQAFDRLLRIGPPGDTGDADPPSVEEIRAVMIHAMNDVRGGPGFPGWGAVIRSAPKFREQYSRLRLEGSRRGKASLVASYEDVAAELERRGL